MGVRAGSALRGLESSERGAAGDLRSLSMSPDSEHECLMIIRRYTGIRSHFFSDGCGDTMCLALRLGIDWDWSLHVLVVYWSTSLLVYSFHAMTACKLAFPSTSSQRPVPDEQQYRSSGASLR